MFDLNLAVNKMNKFSASQEAVAHAFYRNGITDTINASNLFFAIAAMHPNKSLYADSLNNCVRIHGHFEYSAATFLIRINKLKNILKFINAPYLLIAEELKSGGGIDFTLLVKHHGARPKVKLAAPDTGRHYESTAIAAVVTDLYAPYMESILKLKIASTPMDIELEYPVAFDSVLVGRTSVAFEYQDDKFAKSDLCKQILNFSESTDRISVETIRYSNKTTHVKLLTELKKL